MLAADSSLTLLAQRVVEPLGFELVGVELFQHGAGATLRVYIDHAQGITLDDCSAVSHQLSGVLDVEDPLPGHYDLEISSPGLDRPLVFPAHFVRFIDHRVRIRLTEKLEGRRKFDGLLRGYASGIVTLEADDRLWALPLAQIDTARVVADFRASPAAVADHVA
ncbi:ribosome maturation factor RimP [Chromatium okenii]|uniref:ribosome maturation factor RimP n=1 Tax=Chromatium okenii TaxID=61644 RepID=UPI001905F5FC|nr:ribosome maturation factor RimP [Chromatium okenii]MBK1641001.1 ribosome maturation factor RimP [Chromatium okenii]